MELFWLLFFKLLPLYLMIGFGFIATKLLHVQKESISKLLIYIIAPVIIFYGTYTAPLDWENLSLPFVFFTASTVISLLFLKIGGFFFRDATKNLLALSAGTGNTGYFGLPVVSAILGETGFSLAVLSLLAFALFENSIGFFLTARGQHTVEESIRKIIRLPTLYAFLVGLLCQMFSIPLGRIGEATTLHFKGAYTVLGMMLIGMGLANVHLRQIDYRFTGLAFLAKFLAWPAIMLSIIALDNTVFHFYNPTIHRLFIIMSIVPLAANTVALSTEFKIHPHKAAIAVLLSTFFALAYIPFMLTVFHISMLD